METQRAAAAQSLGDQAKSFFSYALARRSDKNYAGAFIYSVMGLALSPGAAEEAVALLETGKVISDPEQVRMLLSQKSIKQLASDHTPTGRYLSALITSSFKPRETGPAVDVAEKAVLAGFAEAGAKLAERAFDITKEPSAEKSPRLFDRITDLAMKLSLFDLAVHSAQAAVELDGGDYNLKRKLTEAISIQMIHVQRLDQPETRFTDNLRDRQQQQRAQAAQCPVPAAPEPLTARIAKARQEYSSDPADDTKFNKLTHLLAESNAEQDQEDAIRMLLDRYEACKSPVVRQRAVDLRLKRLWNELARGEEALKKAGPEGDAHLAEAMRDKREEYWRVRAEEFERRTGEYPSDRSLVFELGKCLLELRRYVEGIKRLQIAREDPKLELQATALLPRGYEGLGWFDAAAQCYRDLLKLQEGREKDPGAVLDAKVGLASSLFQLHQRSGDASFLSEARALVLEVVLRDITHPGALKLKQELEGNTRGQAPARPLPA